MTGGDQRRQRSSSSPYRHGRECGGWEKLIDADPLAVNGQLGGLAQRQPLESRYEHRVTIAIAAAAATAAVVAVPAMTAAPDSELLGGSVLQGYSSS